MSHTGYVWAGYIVVVAVIALYSLAVILRGRRLSRRVAPGERRWM